MIRGSVVRDIAWYGTDGNELSDEVWGQTGAKSVCVMFNGKTLDMMDDDGEKVVDDSFLIVVNASDNGVEYVLPEPPSKTPWRQVLDTENLNDPFCEATITDKAIVGGRSIRVYSDGTAQVVDGKGRRRPAKTL